jgi:hypothetical protein
VEKVRLRDVDCCKYAEEEKWAFGLNFVLRGQYCDEILIALRGLRFGENFGINFRGGLREKRAVQRGIYQLSTYSRTE